MKLGNRGQEPPWVPSGALQGAQNGKNSWKLIKFTIFVIVISASWSSDELISSQNTLNWYWGSKTNVRSPWGLQPKDPKSSKTPNQHLKKVEITKIMIFCCCFCSIDITGVNMILRYWHLDGAPRNLMQGGSKGSIKPIWHYQKC